MCVSQSRFLYEGVKHFEVSVSQSKKSKCLGLAKNNADLAVSQSLAFTSRHPYYADDITRTLPVELGARVTVCSALTALTDVNNVKSWTEQN